MKSELIALINFAEGLGFPVFGNFKMSLGFTGLAFSHHHWPAERAAFGAATVCII